MEVVNTAPSSQGLLHPKRGQLQVLTLNLLCLHTAGPGAEMRDVRISSLDPPAPMQLGLWG